jgi:hypothetical protein
MGALYNPIKMPMATEIKITSGCFNILAVIARRPGHNAVLQDTPA